MVSIAVMQLRSRPNREKAQRQSSDFLAVLCLCMAAHWLVTGVMAFGSEGSVAQYHQYIQDRRELAQISFRQGERLSTSAYQSVFHRHYDSSFDALASGAIADDQLASLFLGLSSLVADTGSESYAELLLSVTRQVHKRDVTLDFIALRPIPSALEHAYHVLISNHLWAAAAELEFGFPDDVVPFGLEVRAATNFADERPGLIVLPENETDKAVARNVKVEEGLWLVAALHPNCWFSAKAMNWLEGNRSTVAPFLPDQTLWITGHRAISDFEYLHSWNKQSKLIQLVLSHNDRVWPSGVFLDVTPAFYILVDGSVVDSVIGWESDDRGADLLNALGSAVRLVEAN